MAFQALEVAHEAVRSLRAPIEKLSRQDGSLADQLRRAIASVPLNIAESAGRAGKDRRYLLTIARGSAIEARAAIRVAVAWGHVAEREVAEALQLIDRVCAMLWRMLNKRKKVFSFL